MRSGSIGGSLGRGLWALNRFGMSPGKLPARAFNRDQPRILSVSVPKSGTHLVERALCLYPRLYRRVLPTVKSNNLSRRHDLDHLLSRVRPGQIVVAHLPFQPHYPAVIAERRVSALFLIRDPRDIVISEAHYVAGTRSHKGHELFARQTTFRDMVLLVIRGDEEHGWLPLAEKLARYEGWLDSGAHVMRFEDLIGSAGGGDDRRQAASLRGMFDYLSLDADDAFVASVGDRLFSKNSPTFRKGAIGGWREHFDPEIQEAFDSTAGRYLAHYGYAESR